MRIDMTLREQLQRITLAVIAYSIIVAALVTAPLVSFLTESPTSLLARWLGAGFVATVIAANLVRACFARKLAGRNTTEPLEDELEPARVIEPAHQNRSAVPSGEAQSGCQRLKIVDLMVLIAAIAFGIALARSFLCATHSLPGVDRAWGWKQLEGIDALLLMLMPLTLSLALSWITHRLHWPLRRIALSPGAIACLLASLVLVNLTYSLAVRCTTEWISSTRQGVFLGSIEFWQAVSHAPPTSIGLLILGVWNLLVISGRWRPETTWLGRCGRVVGICWIGWAVFNSIIVPAVCLMILCGMYGLRFE